MADVLFLHYYLLLPSRPPLLSPLRFSNPPRLRRRPPQSPSLDSVVATALAHRQKRFSRLKNSRGSPLSNSTDLKVHAVVADNNEPKWWEKNAGPNMLDIHSTQDLLDALSQAGDRLVIVEFYGTWCGSCRALYPKLCKTAEENPDILFLKVNFDENKPMCKRLNVRVLPYFHFYRGADGRLESFSCSLAKFQKIKDAIATHNTARCSIGPPLGVGDINLLETSTTQEKPAEASPR